MNLLVEANLDHSILWLHVKSTRSEYRKKQILHTKCKAFVSDEERKSNFNDLKNYLKVSDTTDDIKSLPSSIIEEGGRMFVYLNSCPALHWQNFYHHLLFSKTIPEIILSVLNAMKNSRTKGGRTIANKFLVRLADVFGFTYKHFVNETLWVNNIATVKGIKQTRRFPFLIFFLFNLTDERLLQKVSNHPVHILDSEGDFSPSAFIPFCIFGNNMISLGQKIDALDVPVCNIFEAKVLNDQVCYEMDLNLLKDEGDIKYQLKNGITLVLDFNEERQFKKDPIQEETILKVSNNFYEDEDNRVQVHLDSIGKGSLLVINSCMMCVCVCGHIVSNYCVRSVCNCQTNVSIPSVTQD